MSWWRSTPLDEVRWTVIDCETSGLDIARDRLISVGAVEVVQGRVELATAYSAGVRQDVPSRHENIVIHGIGADAQRAGQPLAEVGQALLHFAQGSVPVAFHAAFDAGILRRHGVVLEQPWLDLALLAPALFPGRAKREAPLDTWLAAFGVPALDRHDALGDAFATAQLLLIALAEGKRQGMTTLQKLRALQRNTRWLGTY